MKLLLAEDEIDLAEALTVFLEKNNYSVTTVNDGLSAYDYASSGNFDGIILDIMMPKMSGIEVLSKLRSDGVSTPVMMLTAKGLKDDRIAGFDAGADDYLPKPFATDELIARLRAMLRRRTEYKSSILRIDSLTLDAGTGEAKVGENSVFLTGKEFELLELFMSHPNVSFSADKLMERIWGWDSESEINVIWVHISNLRKRLKSISSPVNVVASRGLGYRLVKED
ncbi:MAG TPA: DNA-binding response regulator [Clostridiales bacterium]|nr:DNA-binding response regulator [Clostridiales bacterium]